MDLELRQLRVFLAVLDAGGYTRAAEALGVAQSTVSETLAVLERQIGATLFHRVGRTMRPTAAADALVEPARELIALARLAREKVAATSSTGRTRLSLGTVESVGAYVLPGVLAVLRQRWPAARFEVSTGLCGDIRRWVSQGRVDLGLVLEPLGKRLRGGEERIATAELLAFTRADGAVDRLRDVAVDGLRGRVFLLSDSGGPFVQLLRGSFRRSGLPPPRIESLGAMEAVKRSVLDTQSPALGLLPAHALRSELARGQVRLLRLRPALPRLELKAVRGPAARQGGPALMTELLERLTAFVGWLAPSSP